MAEGVAGDFRLRWNLTLSRKGRLGCLADDRFRSCYPSRIDLDVLEHFGVQNVADTSQVVHTQICMVEGMEEIFSEFDLAICGTAPSTLPPESAFYSLQGFLGAGVFAGQG